MEHLSPNDLPLSLRIASGWYVTYGRRRSRKDLAEDDIVKALEKAGCEVWVIERPVDLAVRRNCWPPGMVMLMEVKTGNGKVREGLQEDAVNAASIPVVRTPMEALEALGCVSREVRLNGSSTRVG